VTPADPEVDAWCRRADQLRAEAGTAAGAFVVSLLGESVARGRPTRWFGFAPDRGRLGRLLASYGEQLDVAPLLAAEAVMRDRPLAVTADLAAGWRARLDDDAGAAPAQELGPRDPWHERAAAVWERGAAATSRRTTGLHARVALGQLRWVPGSNSDAPAGYADELGLAATTRAVTEVQFSDAEWDACEEARPLADPPDGQGPDPVAWMRSCVAWAATTRPWRDR
jgi:hypothetical protein